MAHINKYLSIRQKILSRKSKNLSKKERIEMVKNLRFGMKDFVLSMQREQFDAIRRLENVIIST